MFVLLVYEVTEVNINRPPKNTLHVERFHILALYSPSLSSQRARSHAAVTTERVRDEHQ
jgi:hypothetical protein